jgi:D-glycero-alpha-D-manno-heptose 1-phosphate guanylyltransferase
MWAYRKRDVCPVSEAIILAGGLGTRLRPVLADLPKPMAPIAGRPFLAYLLSYLEEQGIRSVILSVGHQHDAICSCFGQRFGDLQLRYAIEEDPLGTGGAIRFALGLVESPFVFVLNGDTFLGLDYTAMAELVDDSANLLAVALRYVKDGSRFGQALLSDGYIRGFSSSGVSGPALINGGVYLMSARLFRQFPMPDKFSFETDFLQPKVSDICPRAFVCDVPFIDIGIPEDYRRSQTLLPEWRGH